MSLKDENATLLQRNGRLEGELSAIKEQLAQEQVARNKLDENYQSLLKQAGELNEQSVILQRESDELRYKIPQLEGQVKTLLDQASKLMDENKSLADANRDLAAAVKALTEK